jgi:putative tryptophan/tyrosine transport system substrate-binding protein
MRRRDLILGLAGAGLWRKAGAQEPGRTYRLGVIDSLARPWPPQAAFLSGLAKLGFVADKNLWVDTQGYGLKPDQYAAHAAALVKAQPDLIFCGGATVLRIARQATTTIPLISIANDMVGMGFAQSAAHPGGNITGISLLANDLVTKRLQILLELLPGARRVGALAGADGATPAQLAAVRDAAHRIGVELDIRTAHQSEEIAPALAALKAGGAAGVNVLGSALLFHNTRSIVEQTAALRLPAVYQWPDAAKAAGLIGYGSSIVRIFGDQLSRIAAEILRGAKPSDIPIENPTRFYLTINLKTAKALGITIPPLLLAEADEVIE